MESASQARRILLLSPPYADYTSPYHALSYVAAPLMAAGYVVDVLDLNAMWFRQVFTRVHVDRMASAIAAEIDRLNALARLDVDQQERLIALVRAMAACRDLEPERAVDTLRGDRFYVWEAYLDAREQVRRFERVLDVVHAPVSFSEAFSVPPHEPAAQQLVEKSARCTGFVAELAELLAQRCGERDYLFVGVSVPYSANLLPGMALLRAVGQTFPGVPRVAGGTAICDVYKYRRSAATLQAFAPLCDVFYIGEAEPGVAQLAQHMADPQVPIPRQAVRLAQTAAELPTRLTYVALSDSRRSDSRRASAFVTYDWRANAPYYGWIDWSLYLAPARRIVYAPTRGCFWNQCTFCDYGLNEDGPTAPSRNMDAEVVVEHLADLAEQGVDHVYFAADAIAPAFLGQIADALVARNLRISWSCQLFLTRNFTPELVSRLERSGLCSASFGLESGSSRLLELMGKGRDRVQNVLEPALAAFSTSRIALQPLFFFGFPTETDEDRQATVDLLLRHRNLFAPIPRAGVFTLLSGSMIARDPGRFGMRNLRDRASDDIVWELDYDYVDGSPPSGLQDYRRFNEQLPYSLAFERPWVGGIDTLHSHLYVKRFGPAVFVDLREGLRRRPPAWIRLEVDSAFDLDAAAQNVVINRAFCADGANACGLFSSAGELAPAVAEVLAPIDRLPQPKRFRFQMREHREN